MGCTTETYWVPKTIVNKYGIQFNNNYDFNCYEYNCKKILPCFDGFESDFYNLIKTCKEFEVMEETNSKITFYLGLDNISILINYCKKLIKAFIDENLETIYSYKYDNDFGGNYCYILKELKAVREIFTKSSDDLLIVELSW